MVTVFSTWSVAGNKFKDRPMSRWAAGEVETKAKSAKYWRN